MTQFRTDIHKIDSNQVLSRYEVFGLMESITPSGTMIDAYGKLRVSNQYSVFTSQRIGAPQEKFNTKLTGTANAVFHITESSFYLNVGASSGDEVIRESKQVSPFQPGKSTEILMSFAFESSKTNLRQRVGYFDEKNGIYFENHDGINYFVIRSYSTGSVVETRIPQSDWNFDKFDGTGYSSQLNKDKFILDPSNVNIFWIDVASFSASGVRAGFTFGGRNYTAHNFVNNNINKSVLMSTLCLPIRFEITNVGNTSGISTLKQVNAAVMSEGGFELNGVNDGASRGYTIATADTLLTAGTEYPLISYRLKADRRNNVVIPHNFHIYVDSNATVSYRIWVDAITSGGVWQSKSNNRHIEYNTGITGWNTTNARVLQGGFVTSQQAVEAGTGLSNLNYILGRLLDGTTQEITLAIIPMQNNTKVLTKADWIELV